MNDTQLQSVEFDVNLPRPRPRNVIGRILAGLAVLVLVGVVALVVISRTATPSVDPLTQLMPDNVALYFSMTTHSDKRPNFQVIANAWKDSREANQVESALQLAVMQAGINWEDDVAPWLGERAGVGLIDLGGTTSATGDQPFPSYRPPAVIVAVQTTDRAKSDACLVLVRKQLESQTKGSNGTFKDEVYRGLNISYLSSEDSPVSIGYATVNDVIVVAVGTDNLKRAIDASLDHSNLAASVTYQKTMGALSGDNVGAVYLDNARYAELTLAQYQQTLQSQPDLSTTFDNIYTNVYSYSNSTPDPNMQKEIEARQQQRETARRQQAEQLQKLRDQLQTIGGGSGLVMTYEPTGIRIDTADYTVPGKSTNSTQLWSGQLTQGQGGILNNVPASALLVIQGILPSEAWQMLLSPEFLASQALNPSWNSLTNLTGKDLPTMLAEFEQKAGVSLKDDLLGLFDGEMAMLVLPKAMPAKLDTPNAAPFTMPSFSVPFELAVMIDSKDAAQAVGTLDKIFQAIEGEADGRVTLKKLDGQPYSTLMDREGNVMLTYGLVDGRVVIGSTADTLQAIDTADQAPISADADFKDASSYLPNGQPAAMYLKFGAIFDWYFGLLNSFSSFSGQPADCGACNYVKPFKYLVTGGGSRTGDLQLGSMFIKIEPVK